MMGGDVFVHTCARCGHRWGSRSELPMSCAGCKAKAWWRIAGVVGRPAAPGKKRTGRKPRYPELYRLGPGESAVLPWRRHPSGAIIDGPYINQAIAHAHRRTGYVFMATASEAGVLVTRKSEAIA